MEDSRYLFSNDQVLRMQANAAVKKSAAYGGVIDNRSKDARAEWNMVRVTRTWPSKLSVVEAI